MDLINGLGGAAGFGEIVLPANLDGSSDRIDLTAVFPNGLAYFGEVFDGLWVNSNGNLTFDDPLSEFVPEDIDTLSIPGLFAFWTDIDVSRAPVDASPGGTSQGTNRVWVDLDEDAGILTATWDDVRPFTERAPGEVDAFQIRLIDLSDEPDRDAGAFRVELRYETIDWVGDLNVFGNVTARVGFTVGDGESFVELGASNEATSLGLLPQRGVLSFTFDDGTVTGADPTSPLRGTDGDDLLLGTDGVDALAPGLGDDTIRPGAGVDAIDLSGGAKTVVGRVEDLLGDRLVAAGPRDSLFFEGVAFGAEAITGALDEAALDFDIDGDGVSDGMIELDAQLPSGMGGFLTTVTAQGTRVNYVRNLPELEEDRNVSGAGRLEGSPATDAYLTSAGDTAFALRIAPGGVGGEDVALGVYEVDGAGAILDARLLVSDVSTAGETEFLLDDVEAGRTLATFLLAPGSGTTVAGGDAFDFVNQTGAPATLEDRSYVFAARDGGIVDATLIHAHDSDLNQDLRQHALIGIDEDVPGLTVAFERTLRFEEQGPGDFSDVVLSIERIATDIVA